MGKILAIDYGVKRVGLALSDEMKIFAFGHSTVDTKNIQQELKKLIEKEKIEKIVLGEPKRLNNEISETTQIVYRFRADLNKWFPSLDVVLVDERFTSKMAQNTIINSGLRKKARSNKALVDTISATIILQTYLETKSI
ncbi:MAG: Holliday junction resolvase RuvX [Chitinophagales bacterium]|nr:Holliday junction resolvase RuvX [Chitinophagales bacterium]